MDLIKLDAYPVNLVLKALLKDKTTGQNIILATDAYTEKSSELNKKAPITIELLKGMDAYVIQPRVSKSLEQQTERTRKKAEVFTPSWICNKMNNYADYQWFGKADLFNTETENGWITTTEPIPFDQPEDWKKYIDSRRLEITCGEAPYIVSRYDAASGEIIPVKDRIGILDRKLRVINENTDNEADWITWVTRAYQSVYGYEFQGDNLLIARINLLVTFVDYMQDRWNRIPTETEVKKITNVIVWNIWQMDGLTGTIPFGIPEDEFEQLTVFDVIEDFGPLLAEEPLDESVPQCRIYDWRRDNSLTYNSIKYMK